MPSVDASLGMKLLSAVLSITAGSVDIISFLGLGRLFAAHITGNLAILASRIAPARIDTAVPRRAHTHKPGSMAVLVRERQRSIGPAGVVVAQNLSANERVRIAADHSVA